MPKCLVLLVTLFQIGIEIAVAAGDTPIPFQSITAEDGLSQATVNTIAQDHSGFLWLGAQDGLNRFDGYDFMVFRADPENDCTLSGSWIRVVYVDGEGVIWVGVRDGGLNRFNEDTGCFQSYRHDEEDPTSLIHDDVNSIFEDSQGRFWVGTHAGLDLMDRETGTFSRFPTISEDFGGVGYDRVRALFEDSRNILWVGTNSGLNAWDASTGEIRVFRHDPEDTTSMNNNEVGAIFEDSKGQFWVGTSWGLHLLDRETGVFQRITPAYHKKQISERVIVKSIEEDRWGGVWVGTLRNGILLIRDNEEPLWMGHQKDNPKSLIHDDVRNIFMDRTGVIWVGTDGGLSRFDRGNLRFSFMGKAGANWSGLSNPWVWAILEDRDGILWVGLDGNGIDRVDRVRSEITNFRSIPGNSNSLSHNRVRSIIQDHAGYYWVGTDGGGLDRFTCEVDAWGVLSLKIKNFKHDPKNPNSLANNLVGNLMEDKQHYLWVGTQEGLTRYDATRLQSLTYRHNPRDSNSLPHNEILSFLQDSRGVVWVGTRNGLGMYIPEKDHFQRIQHRAGDPQSLSHNMARCLAEDAMGNLWIGTYGGGLNKRDPVTGRITRFLEKQGLSNNVVYGVLVANNGHIWASTNRGISRLNPKDISFKNYTTGDGLQANEFNSGAWFASPSGEMFFGGINGLNFFHPNKIVDDPSPPLIAFTRVRVDNEALNADGAAIPLQTITLKPDNHSVSIEFSALHFADPSRNEYIFYLDGFHSTWQKAPASRRFASFTNLDPGDYIFQVKASNKDGVWNPNPIQLNLKVEPPIWLTLWAKCIYVALPFLLLFLNHCRQRAITRRLEQMVSERTEQLKGKNQQLQDTQKELVNAAHGAGMAEIASAILHNAGNVLNSVNTSAQLINRGLNKTPIDALDKSVQMLIDNAHCLPQFLSDDPKGKQLGPFLESLARKMSRENRELKGLSQDLLEKLHLLGDIVAQQNAYISSPFHWETTNLEPVLESALKIMDSSLKEMHVTVIRDLQPTPMVSILKTKLAQGLVNLIKNACYALRERREDNRQLQVKLFEMNGQVHLELSDNGMGIEPGIRDKIFSQGFSTNEASPDLGLHTCANAMHEMGGSIKVDSREPEPGSTFTLIFPIPAWKT